MADAPDPSGADPGPPGGWERLSDLPFYAELAALPPGEGTVNWDVARRVAVWVAAGGLPERNLELIEGATLLELSRVAELHVTEATGLSTCVTGRNVAVIALTRGQWALRAVEAYRPLLDALAVALAGDRPAETGDPPPGTLAPPVLEGLVFGWMVGQLARWSLGQYDLLLPRPPSETLAAIPPNRRQWAEQWRLADDEVALWMCLREVAHHAVLGVPHVHERLITSLFAYVRGFEVDPGALPAVDDVEPAEPGSFRAVLGDPDAVLASVQTPAQRQVHQQVLALAAVVEGYVDRVVDAIAGRLIAGYPQIAEAARRRRAEMSWGDRYVARLLGIELRQADHERGARFIEGVVERAGEDAVARLWRDAESLPTPAEVDAPGLWLARLDLGD